MTRRLLVTLFVSMLLFGCDTSDSVEITEPSVNSVRTIASSPMTKDELESWLQERYGHIERSQSLWALSEEGSAGTFAYRLRDGRFIEVDGYATKDLEYFVDPSFDFSKLPAK